MDIQKLKDLPIDEIENVLAEATTIDDNITYYRPMDPTEVSIVQNELSVASIEKSYLEEEIEEAKQGFKERMEPIKERVSEAIAELKTKTRKITGKVYTLADHETNMVHMVDSKGNAINSRQMKPEERQYRLPVINKAAI